MKSLEIFLSIVEILDNRAFEFLTKTEQEQILSSGAEAIGFLKDVFEKKSLIDNPAYETFKYIGACFSDSGFGEVAFVTGVQNLAEIYKLSSVYQDFKDMIDQLIFTCVSAKQKLLEYHIALNNLQEKAAKMSPEQQNKSDMEIIQKIGIFYILELTVYMLYILPQLDDKSVYKMFYEGLKTKEANLPPYSFFSESFRKELTYKIFDEALRKKLMVIFYKFEEVFGESDLKEIRVAFKTFNLEILKAFKEKGIQIFKTVFLSPFGKKIEMDNLIRVLEGIEFGTRDRS